MLHLEFSNRVELLLDSFLNALGDSPESPFVADQVIVPSAAVRRKLELSIADRYGICANIRFSFLAQWLWRQIGQVVAVEDVYPFTPSILTWRILGIFEDTTFV